MYVKTLLGPVQTAFMLAVFAVSAQAEFSAELAAGLEYDSNVAVDSIDSTSGLGDWSRNLNVALGASGRWSANWEWNGRYQGYDSQWQNYSQYDTQMHTGLGKVTYKSSHFINELAGVYAQADVNGQAFLTMRRISPATGSFIGQQWYWRAQYDRTQKQFVDYPLRDSDGDAVGLYLYRFLDKTRHFISANVQLKREQTPDDIYQYQGGIVRLGWKRAWQVGADTVSTQIKARYEMRQYDGIRSDILAARHDDKIRLSADLDWQMTPRWSAQFELIRDWNESNLQAADYKQFRIDSRIRWRY